MALALAIALLVYVTVQAYAFLRLGAALDFGAGAWIAAVAWIALMTLAPVAAWRLERRGAHRTVTAVAWLGYGWMGFAFQLFWILLVLDLAIVGVQGACAWWGCNAQAVLPRPVTAVALAFALAVLLSVYGVLDARRLRVRRIVLRSPKLEAAAGPITVAQVSDVHLGALIRAGQLRRIVSAVAAAAPDLVVSTGDLLDGQADHLDGLSDLLASLAPRLGKFAVLGNHECYVGLKRAVAFHERAGFTVLRNDGRTVAGILNVAGIDDPAAARPARAAPRSEEDVLGALPRAKFTLLLKHQPLLEPRAQGLFDLQLSGHVHGGQIFPFGLLPWITYRVPSGLTRLAGGWLYVSRGAGTWGPPMRVFAPPEIAVIELRPAA